MTDPETRPGAWPVRVLCVLAMMLAGCDEEPATAVSIPPDYVGIWEMGRYGKDEDYVYLQISADGYLAYARVGGNEGRSSCVTMEGAQVDDITGTEISTSVLWLFDTEFEIDEPPTAFGETMRMSIDGRTLTRTDRRKGGFDYTWDCDGDLVRTRVH